MNGAGVYIDGAQNDIIRDNFIKAVRPSFLHNITAPDSSSIFIAAGDGNCIKSDTIVRMSGLSGVAGVELYESESETRPLRTVLEDNKLNAFCGFIQPSAWVNWTYIFEGNSINNCGTNPSVKPKFSPLKCVRYPNPDLCPEYVLPNPSWPLATPCAPDLVEAD